MDYKLIFFAVVLVVFSSCTSNEFRILEQSGNNPGVVMEAKQRRGLFGHTSEFELKIINNSSADLHNCRLEFNNKYSHPINGLHTREKGLYKKDILSMKDTVIIPFTADVENMFFFKVPEEGFEKQSVRLICDECNVEWKIE